MMCLDRKCLPIPSLNMSACPSGSNGPVCSGHGVSCLGKECFCKCVILHVEIEEDQQHPATLYTDSSLLSCPTTLCSTLSNLASALLTPLKLPSCLSPTQ
ncbi:UNVERIFIED_CONTAM: hypothetical protein FKN15_004441 [Acipenser sinensis]